jgi:FkbM family methyltransferase
MPTITKKLLKYIKSNLLFASRKLLGIHNVTISGVMLNTRSPLLSKKMKNVILKGYYESHELKVISTTLKKNDRVLEVGAGIGFISSFCAKHVGSENVIAVEANPNIIPIIEKTYKDNDVDPVILNYCLSDQNRTETFHIEDDFWSSSAIKRSAFSSSIQVKAVTLDHLNHKYQFSYLIMDIEGYETVLLHSTLPNSINKICIELHPHIIGIEKTSKIIRHILNHEFDLDTSSISNNVYFFSRADKTASSQ